jgi:hypothetical protein
MKTDYEYIFIYKVRKNVLTPEIFAYLVITLESLIRFPLLCYEISLFIYKISLILTCFDEKQNVMLLRSS